MLYNFCITIQIKLIEFLKLQSSINQKTICNFFAITDQRLLTAKSFKRQEAQ